MILPGQNIHISVHFALTRAIILSLTPENQSPYFCKHSKNAKTKISQKQPCGNGKGQLQLRRLAYLLRVAPQLAGQYNFTLFFLQSGSP
jgi:hypothetical protein